MIQDIRATNHQPGLVEFWFFNVVRPLQRLKAVFLKQIIGYVTAPAGGLIEGMIFGGYDGLSPAIYHYFKTIGMLHVVAASGYNVGVVMQLAGWLFQFLRGRLKTFATISVIWVYYFLADQAVSVLRAASMATYVLIVTHLWHRQYRPIYGLVVFLVISTLLDARLLTDLSLILSVSSTVGIISCMPIFSRSPGVLERLETLRLETRQRDLVPLVVTPQPGGQASWFSTIIAKIIARCSSIFRESLLVTLAAQSLTLPITLAIFEEFNLISLVANAALIWMTPLLTMGGIGIVGLGLVAAALPGWSAVLLEILTEIAGMIITFGGAMFITAAAWFSQFNHGVIRYQLKWWGIVSWYGLLAGGLWYYYHSRKISGDELN